MAVLDRKRLAVIYCYIILNKYSSREKPLTQDEVADKLNKLYDIELERKAVGRVLNLLMYEEFGVEKSKGYYLEKRLFTDAELRLLADSVLTSRYIDAESAKKIIERLKMFGSEKFKNRIKNSVFVERWNRSLNGEILSTIDTIDEAISLNKQISFDYNKYDCGGKRHKTSEPVVSPYQLIVKNQRYYLFSYNAKHEGASFYHIDRMTNVKILNEPLIDLHSLDKYRGGIDYSVISKSLPFMFADNITQVVFTIPSGWDMENEVYESFGDMAKFSSADGLTTVTITASEMAMEHWALNYLDKVEILSPASLRKKMRDLCEMGLAKYSK